MDAAINLLPFFIGCFHFCRIGRKNIRQHRRDRSKNVDWRKWIGIELIPTRDEFSIVSMRFIGTKNSQQLIEECSTNRGRCRPGTIAMTKQNLLTVQCLLSILDPTLTTKLVAREYFWHRSISCKQVCTSL